MRRRAVHRVTELDLVLPLEAYARAFPRRSGAFLLDGAGGPEAAGLARTALFGGEPVLSFRASRTGERTSDGRVRARVQVGDVDVVVDDPLPLLRDLFAERTVEALEDVPLPLRAGAVGYVGYEAGQMLERLPCRERPRLHLPDIAFAFHDWVLGRCARTGRAWLSVVGRGETDAEASRRADATTKRLEEMLRRCAADAPRGAASSPPSPTLRTPAQIAELAAALGVRAGLSRAGYLEAVRKAKRHIEEGDAFEICLTNALEVPFAGDPFALWRDLRRANPSPFAAWLDFPEAAVVSSSPERFLSLGPGGVAESRPIKGTRPRGHDEAEDDQLARELAASEKDRAENTMIVDLVRNDLGRVCRFGSVEVTELCAIERYPSVHQMVSTVRGRLDEGKDAIDLLRACFPPGSMTGAPKIEAMSLLEALEPVERGVYSGALGFFDVSGTLDLSVVIRTAVVQGGRACFSVGGAVVADSSPEGEHDETLVKARALLEAIARVRGEASL